MSPREKCHGCGAIDPETVEVWDPTGSVLTLACADCGAPLEMREKPAEEE